ncbi:hypothetical protein ESCAB7627_4645 [Escherichia albertii TW07627]|uniref:Uncharacterized protein n=1 Tax=Escherichia albertii (strain TW07627) TaxID=502347 RepID=A0ABC9NSX5_ESCAT|nr:hypothetical protein ESCAB7627_4645 [Escherichia albertii TW07627]
MFDTGTLNKLTNAIWMTLPLSAGSIDIIRPANPTEPLFKIKYLVCVGLNSVKRNVSCCSLMLVMTPTY